jgi:hypothetical protein
VVPDRAHRARARQQVSEVTTPPGWVVANASADGRSVVQHRLDALAYSACRLGLGRPNRLKHLEHDRRIDIAHLELA